jgi:signal transduction histidine kinase
MAVVAPTPGSFQQLFAWRRVRVVLATCFAISLLMLVSWRASYALLIGRLLLAGVLLLLVFSLFERWPSRLPRWLARWALQVIAVALMVPIATAITYALTTLDVPGHWWADPSRMNGYRLMTGLGVLIAPWVAISALLRQIKGEAERQALAFELERSEFERQALAARLRLLQGQVEPHFLFNTLANVRELVDSGSPQASTVLASLIAYLRAAVPRLHEQASTLGRELDLVRAYLEVMQMRMPDRLQYFLHADDAARILDCPPMSLLTLVENAVRHGIDPSEVGGRIEVRAQVLGDRCRVQVIDTGVGLGSASPEGGTGLANLRERLQLAFGGGTNLRLIAIEPHGTSAEIEFPARRSAP